MQSAIELEQHYSAHNVAPIPIVFTKGEGCWLWDTNGKQYLDMAAALAVQNFGHCHPKLVAAAQAQAAKLTLCSRLFYSDTLGPFLEKLCQLTHMDQGIPMNSGTEAYETAIKAARQWGHITKGIADNQAEIIVCSNNFHGRTLGAMSSSDKPPHRAHFGPFAPGFQFVPFNDAAALEQAITPNTAALIIEPIQGEGGIRIPDPGYLKHCAAICQANNVLLILDEIQTGVGRTGTFLYCQQEGVQPDAVLLGKGLGGGILPVSAMLGSKKVMEPFKPGSHGNTFGGSALAAAVGHAALTVLETEKLCQHATEMGAYLLAGMKALQHPAIKAVRGKGLLTAVEFDPKRLDVSKLCNALAQKGLLVINTHNYLVRIAPPLIITHAQIDQGLSMLNETLETF